MTELKPKENKDEEFLNDLEASIRVILKGRKTTPTEKLAAINAGVRLSAIRHRIGGTDDGEKGFFER